MKRLSIGAACLLFMIFFNIMPSMAKWGTFTMTDDQGDEVKVKHSLFGKKTVVKDRNGNGFEHSRSIFGLTKDTKVGALGNDMHVHKGLFGFGKTEANDMLGDTVKSKKNLLFRNTNVDMNGANSFLTKMFSKPNQAKPNIPSPAGIDPNTPLSSSPLAGQNQLSSPVPLVSPGQFSRISP